MGWRKGEISYLRRPPKCKATIWDLVESRSLSIRELLKLHRLFEATSLCVNTMLAFVLYNMLGL
jgi:hypothetical protein